MHITSCSLTHDTYIRPAPAPPRLSASRMLIRAVHHLPTGACSILPLAPNSDVRTSGWGVYKAAALAEGHNSSGVHAFLGRQAYARPTAASMSVRMAMADVQVDGVVSGDLMPEWPRDGGAACPAGRRDRAQPRYGLE
jgi:hypothetical protein